MHKIVIIEDDELLLDLLQKKLKQEEGYEVSVARDIADGLAKIQEVKPDVVLLDMILARKGASNVLSEIKNDPILTNISVIAIVNSDQSIEMEQASQTGADDYLIKTKFDPAEALTKISNLLNK